MVKEWTPSCQSRPGETPPDCAGMEPLVVAHEIEYQYARDGERAEGIDVRLDSRSLRVFA